MDVTGTEGKHSSSVCDTADLCRTQCKTFPWARQRGSGNEVYSALPLMPCKSTSGTELHRTNNLITSLRTQMDEDAMYRLSLLWRFRVQMRSLITSRLETLRQKGSANICRLNSSRQNISGVHHLKSYLVGKWDRLSDDQMHVLKTGFYREFLFGVLKQFVFKGTNSLMKKCLPTGISLTDSRRSHCYYALSQEGEKE